MPANKARLDERLVREAFFPTLETARGAIMAGLVYVDERLSDKPGALISLSARLRVKRPASGYVSRGGLKLAKAIKTFRLDFQGKVVLDAGASTGGFTDCALQHGAALVYAVDVNYGQLAWRLRQDPRVKALERTNIRYLGPERLEPAPELAVIDLSFISLTTVLPNIFVLLRLRGEGVALLKPQFEAPRARLEAKGVVRDPQVHQAVLAKIVAFIEAAGGQTLGLDFSPLTGPAGNIEYLLHFRPGRLDPEPASGEKQTFNYSALVAKAREELLK